MSLGAVVEVAIGLAFTYMLLGLIASAVQETVAAFLKLRGKQLRDGVKNLLAADDAGKAGALFKSVFGHSLIQSGASDALPSYIPARNFAVALFEHLSAGKEGPLFSQLEQGIDKLPEGAARDSLVALVRQAGGDIEKFKASVETWFDDAADRISGFYKRFSHYFSLAFGLAVAIVFNVDSINIAHTLWIDSGKRAAIVAAASSYAGNTTEGQTGSSAEQMKAAEEQLTKLDLPIGWDLTKYGNQNRVGAFFDTVFKSDGGGLIVVLGWLATAFAVSLGAPFWFDAMKGLLNIRAAGPKPARSDETPKK